jgi:hypothetical protein
MVVIHCANQQKRTHVHGQGTSVGSQRNSGILASVRRVHSVPEQLGLAGIGAAAASFVYPAVNHATGVGLPCPLRTLIGIPCPLCGMTTAATGLAAGDVHAALVANPFVLPLAAGTVWMAGLFLARVVGMAPLPAPWSVAARRRLWWVAGVLAAASWAFQLHRFGVA